MILGVVVDRDESWSVDTGGLKEYRGFVEGVHWDISLGLTFGWCGSVRCGLGGRSIEDVVSGDSRY